jgi:hypothetical protein
MSRPDDMTPRERAAANTMACVGFSLGVGVAAVWPYTLVWLILVAVGAGYAFYYAVRWQGIVEDDTS